MSSGAVCIASFALCFLFVLPLLFVVEDCFTWEELPRVLQQIDDHIRRLVVFTKKNTNTAALFGRKLSQSADGNGEGEGSDRDGDGDGSDGNGDGSDGNGDGSDGGDRNRVGIACSKDDITIFQGETAPVPNGIPASTVQIVNMCVSGCSISDIHINCGWFSSARFVNPRVFRRMDYDNCLVNDGLPLGPGQTLSFQYANTFRYPLSVSSVGC